MYSRIINILDENFDGRWFLDSGSLLGIIRDGKFLKQDKGIDISVLIDDYHSPIFEKCIRQFQIEGFVISRYQWDGTTYKYCLAPKSNISIKYAIDLHLFKMRGEDFICPQMRIIGAKSKIIERIRSLRKGNMYKHKDGITGFFENLLNYFYRDVFGYFGKPVNMNILTNSQEENIFKWFIPSNLFRGVEKETYYGFNVLKDCDDYLTFRYANWHIPVSNWVTLRDDGGIAKSSIEEIRELLQ